MRRFRAATTAATTSNTASPAVVALEQKKARKPPAKFKGTDHWISKEQFAEVCAAEPNSMYVAIFKVMASHGMRVSEVLALRRDDVANGFIVARRLKGSQVTMQKLLVNLDAFIAAPTYRLFPVSRSSVFLHYRKAATKAGLHPFLRHPHTLKHSCAHWLLRGGTDLATTSRYLGHTSLSSTAAYLNVSDTTASAAAEQIIGTL